jgi:hypothetical protein
MCHREIVDEGGIMDDDLEGELRIDTKPVMRSWMHSRNERGREPIRLQNLWRFLWLSCLFLVFSRSPFEPSQPTEKKRLG